MNEEFDRFEEHMANDESHLPVEQQSLVFRLRKRAEIRRQIPDRKSVQEGEPDRIADLLEEAADALDKQWVGLTDEEVKDIVWNLPYEPSQEHIRAIEAKLKEKNT